MPLLQDNEKAQETLLAFRRYIADTDLEYTVQDRKLFYHISFKKFPHIMLRIEKDGQLRNHNKPALRGFNKIDAPVTATKFSRLSSALVKLDALYESADAKTMSFMSKVLAWTSRPSNKIALQAILKYKDYLRPFRTTPKVIYRGMVLLPDDYKALKNGKTIKLDSHTSWSKDLKKAKNYARGIHGLDPHINVKDKYAVVFKLERPKVFFDIDAFFSGTHLMDLVEAGALDGEYEPGTAYEKECIMPPVVLSEKHIVYTSKI